MAGRDVTPGAGRARTPTVLQMEAGECGAASLGIILAYHRRIVPLELLREECAVGRDGAKAGNILAAARRFGLEGEDRRYDPETVAQVPMPVVVAWQSAHFLVLEGFHRGQAYLNDPAEGPRRVSRAEFARGFQGVALIFKPTPDFRPGGEARGLVPGIVRRLAGSRDGLVFALVAGTALLVPGIVVPAFTRIFVDRVLLGGLRNWTGPLLLGMAATALVGLALSTLQGRVLRNLELKLATTSLSRFFWHVLRLPMGFFSQRYGGEVANRLGYNLQVSQFLSTRLAGTAIDLLKLVVFLPLLIAYDGLLTLAGLLAVAAMALATAAVNRRRANGNSRFLQEHGKAMGALMGGLANIESVKATGTETSLFARWAGYQANYMTARQEVDQVSNNFLVLPALINDLTSAAVLSLGAWRVIRGGLTVGELVAFQTLLTSFMRPMNRLVALAGDLQTMEGLMDRVDDVTRYPVDPQVTDPDPLEPPQRLQGHLELRAVSFGYSRLGPALFQGLDLRLGPGMRVALVGPTGCGKSTLLRLITGLYQPWAGEILLDGLPRARWPRQILAASLAAVDQDPVVFTGTLRENLTFWDATVPEPVLVQACMDACIHEEISRRPGAYDSPMEEAGRNFSGGQLQRLEIARALASEPRILLLDEATSALDTVTEGRIVASLRRRGCACVIAAQRLSTVRDADEIIVLAQGGVVDRGSHRELMVRCGLYRQLGGEP
jgi:NHLM bacteriocin system ABC transporter peptidase/ATP-binding protein